MLQQLEQFSISFQERYHNNCVLQGADEMQPSTRGRQQSSSTLMDGSEAADVSQLRGAALLCERSLGDLPCT